MDTSDFQISFDHLGHCNHCRYYLEKIERLLYRGQTNSGELAPFLEAVRRKKRGRYDCVVGISGGIDSSYLLWLAKQWGLSPLAVHLDNGWNSEEAVRNIQRVCRALDVDYQSYVLDWQEFRSIQLAFLKASIVEMEIPTDVAIMGALHKVAAEHGIKAILSGGNLVTEAILPRSWFYHPKDARLLRHICTHFGARPLKTFPTFDFPTEIYYKFFRGVKLYYPLNFVHYERKAALDCLRSSCNWLEYGGKHHESRFTKFVQSYIQPLKFGVDYRRATCSTLICSGKLTREEALQQLALPPYDAQAIEREKTYVAKKLGISPAELDSIIQLPVKSYRDYPNNEKLLDIIYKIYRVFFGKSQFEPI